MGDLTFEAVNNESDALVQQVVQIGGGHGPSPPSSQSEKKSQGHEKKKKMCMKENSVPLPKIGDPSYDGSGGSHFVWVYAIARLLGSTNVPRPGVVESQSKHIWATPSTLD